MPYSPTLKINTPIGSLTFGASIQEGDLANCKIKSFHISPKLPVGMTVSGCMAVILQCLPNNPFKGFTFSCEWDELKTKGYSCSGQGLDAWEWESEGVLVLIGTEDFEYIESRLELKTEFPPENYPVTMANNKVSIAIESLEKNKEISLHYVIAWNHLPESVEDSCWYAVDIPHNKIIQTQSNT